MEPSARFSLSLALIWCIAFWLVLAVAVIEIM